MSTLTPLPSTTSSRVENTQANMTATGEDIYFYMVGLVCAAVCLLGVVANCLTLFVWSGRHARRYPCVPYFIALAIYDTLYLACVLCVASFMEIVNRFSGDHADDIFHYFYDPSSVFFPFFMNVNSFGSVYTTAALATDRCLAVVRPLTWPQTCGVKKTVVVLVLVLAWSMFVNIPIALEGKLSWVYLDHQNHSYLLFTETSYRYSYFHTEVYLFPAVSFVIPIVTILITNILLVFKVRSRSNSLKKAGLASAAVNLRDGAGHREAQRLMWQVVVISFLTLLSRCLVTVEYVWLATVNSIYVEDCSLGCVTVSAFGKLALALNSSLNFFCYLYFTRTFRLLFLRRFPCVRRCVQCCVRCRKRKERSDTSVSVLNASSASCSYLPSDVIPAVHLQTYRR